MIKIISYVDIAFFYKKADILLRWSNIKYSTHFHWEQRSVSWLFDLIDSDENLHCLTRPLSSCDIKISVVTQCRILVAVQYMNTQLFAFFFSTDNLHLLDCSVTWSLLTQTGAD